MVIPLIVLLARAVTVGRLRPLSVLVPVVALPARAIFKALAVTVPEAELLVRERLAKLSLLTLVIKESANLPDERVKFPEVIVSLPEVRVKLLPEETVVLPPKVTLPVEVEKEPVEEEASKLPPVWVYPVIFSKAPPLVKRLTLLVNNLPSERFKSAVLAPLLFKRFKVEVEAWLRSKVVVPLVKETLVSAIFRSLKVLVPVKIWVVPKSARVTVPVGIVAVVPPVPVVRVTGLFWETAKLPSKVKVPVVQEGALVPPERRA